jgi:multiple sugar transport system permease protein
MFAAVMAITSSFGFGGIVSALAGNPPTDYAGYTIAHHLDEYGGTRFEMGYASAIATILFSMMIGANLLVQRMLNRVGK